MNDYLRRCITEAIEDNVRIDDLIEIIHNDGVRTGRGLTPKGLPGVTEQQVAAVISKFGLLPAQGVDLGIELTDWFNDPNRDAPAMHLDLEWLASRPVSDFRLNCDRSKVLGFYRIGEAVAAALRPEDGRLWASNNPPVFSLEAIHQARGHLDSQKAKQPTMSREGALEALRGFFCYEPQAYRNAIVSDMAADAKMLARALQVLTEEDQTLKAPPHVGVRKDVGGRVAEDCTPLHLANQKIKDESRQHLRDYVEDVRDQLAHDLVNLPDYETWFEKHGWETVNRDTRMAVIDSDVPTTVHELYTHFRARLLDELRQAGVLGDER